MMTVCLQWWLLLAITLSCWFLPPFFISSFLEENYTALQSCCDYVICWTMFSLFQVSYWLSLFFNFPLFLLPWLYMTLSAIYLILPHIFLSPSTVPSGIAVFPSLSGALCFHYPSLFVQNAGSELASSATSLPLLNLILKNCFFHGVYNKVDGYNGSVERHVHGPNRNSD